MQNLSYGFHRLGSNVDPAGARAKLAAIMGSGDPPPRPKLAALVRPSLPPSIAATEVGPPHLSRSQARGAGYTGDQCDNCNGMKMQQTGHCKTCADCGTTTGCS